MKKKKKLLIVFCGPDGSGKTTLAKKLTNYLKKRKLCCHFIHAHQYTFSPRSFGFKEIQVNRFKYLLRIILPLALFDNFLTYFFKYRPVLKKSSLICDRYFYDKLARMLYYGIATKTLVKIYLKLLPKPGLAFFLTGTAKKKISDKELKDYKKNYRFLAREVGAIKINTNLSKKICFNKIKNYLNETLS